MTLGNLNAGDYIDLRSNGAILVGNAVSGETINLLTTGTITGGNLTAGNQVLGESTGAIQLGNISAGITDPSTMSGAQYAARFSSGGNIATGNVTAVGRIGFGTPASLVTGNQSSGGGLMALVGGNTVIGSINADYVYLANHSMSSLGGAFATFDRAPILALAPVASGGSIAINGPVGTGRFEAAAGTTLTTGAINSGGLLYATSGGNMTLGNLFADDDVRLTSGGNLTTEGIESFDDIVLTAAGSISTLDIFAYDDVSADAGATITTDDITGNTIDLIADGAIATGDLLTQNLFVGETQLDPGASITVRSVNNIQTESINSRDGVVVVSNGSIQATRIEADDFVELAANRQIQTADVVAGDYIDVDSEGGSAVLGNLTARNAIDLDSGGALAFGNVSARTLDFEAVGAATGRNVTANSIRGVAGGNATIDGLWRSPSVSLRSGDIAITTNGSIDAGTNGEILLQAVNANGPALIGDGLTGTGYALSNAEFGRASGGTITVAAGGFGGNGDMRIGDLTITGPQAGSNIESSDGGVEFATLNGSGNALDGSLRIVGDVVATGFGADNYLGFYTRTFELDAATGSIAITASGNALAGILEVYASRIHVAETNLLNQLAVNPQFAGYREALNRPATVQRPEGVIRAASFEIEFGGAANNGPYTMFVQNSGSNAIPAGFLLSAANISDDSENDLAAGSLDLAINGQIINGTGTITGVAVRDFLVTEFGTTPFAAGSTINGCPLTGSCIAAPIRVDTPVRTDVQLTDNSGLGDGLFGNEGDIDDGEDGDAGDRSSPIAAPNPLFDSRPLAGTGDVDDPVSGAGNPSLMGTSEDDIDECDISKDTTCKTGKKGDGK